jgi:uncharacterized membrane protein YvbJ
MQLTGFECPNCGASEMVPTEDRQLHCVFCGSSFGEITRICPKCGHYNEDEVRHCSQCGATLIRDCPVCGADNWALAEHCVQCGRNIDVFERMSQRWQKTVQQHLEERRASMAALKEQQERASQARMATFMEAERDRQVAIAQAREAQRERDRQLLIITGITTAVFIVIVVLLLLLTSGGG